MNKFIPTIGLLTAVCLLFLSYIAEISAIPTGQTLSFSTGKETIPQIKGMQTQIKAGQKFSTQASEIREILFPDGTALTLGESSEVIIETYDYNESSRIGNIVLQVKKGMIRLVGGVINNSNKITIKTPTSDILLDNASTILEITKNGTRATLLYGQELTMTNDVDSESLVRPEFELLSIDKSESLIGPQRQSSESVAAYLSMLSTRKLSSQLVSGNSTPIDSGNSKKSENILALATEEQPSGNIKNRGTTGGIVIPERPGTIEDAVSGSNGFGPGNLLGAANTDGEQATVSNTGFRSLTQNRDPFSSEGEDTVREPGPTTNRIFNSEETFIQVVDTNEGTMPTQAEDRDNDHPPSPNLQYVFRIRSILLDNVGDEGRIDFLGRIDSGSSASLDIPFAFGISTLPSLSGRTKTSLVPTGILNFPSSVFGNVEYVILQSGFSEINLDFANFNEDGTHPNLVDTIWEEVTFNTENFFNEPGANSLVSRERDNFLLIQARPAIATQTLRDEIKAGKKGDFKILDDGNGSVIVSNRDDFITAFFGENSGGNVPPSLTDKKTDQIAQVILGDDDLKSGLNQLLEKEFINSRLRNIAFTRASIPADGATLTVDTNRNERFLFATGDITGLQAPLTEREVHQFFISAGLVNFEDRLNKTIASDIRAFLRSQTAHGLNLHDSGVQVVYPYSDAASDAQIALLHADLGLNGNGNEQRSTISVTLGELKEDESSGVRHANLTGHTVASSRNNRDRDSVSGETNASVLATSTLFNTASGGGNPELDRAGRAGYIVLENFDPADPNSGGVERPLNNTGNEERYAFLRLATATGAETKITGTRETLQGWAAGLAEFQKGDSDKIGIRQIDSGVTATNVEIETSPETNRLSAILNLTTDGETFKTFAMGGLSGDDNRGTSAFIDVDTFAARTLGGTSEMAMVAGNLVKAGLPADMQAPIRDYQHLKWGFFFGDTITTANSREHVHLGSWVVGKMADPSNFPSTGTATYSGHAIGNVYNNGSLYTAVGTYNNAWNFATRTGTVEMDFDGTNLTGQTQLRNNSVVFDGVVNSDLRIGGVQGNFVQGGDDAAAGVAGKFSIQQTPDAAEEYRASGTFAAEK